MNKKSDEYVIEVKKADQITSREFEQIYAVETAIFPDDLRESPETMWESISNKKGIYLVVKNRKDGIVGYIFCVPHDDAYEGKQYDRMKDYDFRLEKDVTALYVGNVAVLPNHRRQGLFFTLCMQMIAEAKRAGYKRLTMHVRNDLSPLLQIIGARRFYSVSNWFESGETVDYLKFVIRSQ